MAGWHLHKKIDKPEFLRDLLIAEVQTHQVQTQDPST